MILYRAVYKGKQYGRLLTAGQKAVVNSCILNLTWEETE